MILRICMGFALYRYSIFSKFKKFLIPKVNSKAAYLPDFSTIYYVADLQQLRKQNNYFPVRQWILWKDVWMTLILG